MRSPLFVRQAARQYPIVILDTNVLVAAGFNPCSHSAHIVEQVRQGIVPMVWHEKTRQETEFILRKIPPLSWDAIADLFRPEQCYTGELIPAPFMHIPDPQDIKFAALAEATGAILITIDSDLLSVRDTVEVIILQPFEFLRDLEHFTKSRESVF